jgi:hypothetical protein
MQPKYGSLIEPSLDLSQGPVAEEPRAASQRNHRVRLSSLADAIGRLRSYCT